MVSANNQDRGTRPDFANRRRSARGDPAVVVAVESRTAARTRAPTRRTRQSMSASDAERGSPGGSKGGGSRPLRQSAVLNVATAGLRPLMGREPAPGKGIECSSEHPLALHCASLSQDPSGRMAQHPTRHRNQGRIRLPAQPTGGRPALAHRSQSWMSCRARPASPRFSVVADRQWRWHAGALFQRTEHSSTSPCYG